MMVPEFMRLGAQRDKAIDELRKATLNPFLEKQFGYVDPQTKIRRAMADTDFSNADSIQNTFNNLMKENPNRAAEWLKAAEPLIKSYDERAKAAGKSGLTTDQAYKQRRDKFDRIVKQYESKFCRGSMVGKTCEVPRNLRKKYGQVDEKGNVITGSVKLPSVKEFFKSEAGALGPSLYDEFMGGYSPYETISPAQFQQKAEQAGGTTNTTPTTPTEDTDIVKRFNLEDVPELVQTVQDRLAKGESVESIIEKINQYKAKKSGTQTPPPAASDLVPEQRMGKTVMVEPTIFPQGESYGVQQTLQEQEEDVLSSKFPGLF